MCAEIVINGLLHLWSVADGDDARVLLKQQLVEVQATAKVAWEMESVPSLEMMVHHIEWLGGTAGLAQSGFRKDADLTDDFHLCHAGMDGAFARWIYLVIIDFMAFSSNVYESFDQDHNR